MVIVLVVDSFKNISNGTSMTAFRFFEALKKRGHIMRVVAPNIENLGSEEEGYYSVKERYIPISTEFSHRQHILFAKPDKEVLKRAFKDADIIHTYLPFLLEKVAVKIARKMKIPYIGSFHLQPEHISYNMKMQRFGWFNRALFAWFKCAHYRYIHHIHCPSKLIQEEIEKHGYGGKKYAISNGFDPMFKGDREQIHSLFETTPFKIVMVGRYSNEKNQSVLIEAISLSKHKKDIVLLLKGKGPNEKKLQHLAKKLGVEVEFGFVDSKELLEILKTCTLYVHAANVEGEAIACLEAISVGIVPIIANSSLSATKQFALDERSLFEANNAKDLSAKIDWWLENPLERERMQKEYAKSALNYTLESSVDKIERVYQEAILDFNNNPQLFASYAR
ncbi:glycosyltransferase [Helicobacter cetorum]|uniref:Type 1 capsular polysaccharide biosynthesis protein J n=1 Tax=Helicobacter cetorum (strain ATCC BAA-429 / MIT 00-7128) TaxID=182217 RepID=I0EP93_HELC0|nr:glycosyltransferase [Helicobacter cetorum]AFI04762.1 type 1 capsular polysaccharide biosynthesis protein J [Helicobacter cetorum MIT 00-7128]